MRSQMRGGRAVQEQEMQHKRARVGARDARRDVEEKCKDARRLEEKVRELTTLLLCAQKREGAQGRCR